MTRLPVTCIAGVLAFAATASTACTRNAVLDVAMQSAKHPSAHRGMRVGPYEVLAGDMHTHVMPPDAPWHVTRELPETLDIARAEGFDFIVLTPHVSGRFFADPRERPWVFETQTELRTELDALQKAAAARGERDLIVIPGMEYTDSRWGHVGLAFADVREVLEEVSLDEGRSSPERFFERWLARGGLVTINHPVLRPIPDSPIATLRYDMGWRELRPLIGLPATPTTAPTEIAWVSEHAQAIETFNLPVGHLRDQFMQNDEDRSMREAAILADRIARAHRRRITPVGGSDSHGSWIRGTTWVLAEARTPSAIRDAIAEGRTCVRGPEACTFEARPVRTGEYRPIGSSLWEAPETIEVRAGSAPEVEATYYVNGDIAGRGAGGEVVELTMPRERCALVRAVVGRSWSAPIYVGCPFATPSEKDWKQP